jgi:two-component system chemotaxis response regulator CheY
MDTKRILVVDDSATVRQLLSLTLRKLAGVLALEIVEAGDGSDALEKVRTARFDLVLTDIKMPHSDGLEFLRLLREVTAEAERPVVVIISTKGEEEDVARGMALGAVAYFTKPVSTGPLLATIGDVLGCAVADERAASPGE